MFTRDIRSLVSLRKGSVKWNDALTHSADNTNLYDASQNLRTLWEANKSWGNTPERKAFLEALEKFTSKNIDNQKLLLSQITDEIYALNNSGDIRGVKNLEDFKKQVEKDYTDIQKKFETDKSKVKATTKTGVTEVRETKGKNLRTAQRDAFVSFLEGSLPSMKNTISTKFREIERNTGEAANKTTEIDLADVSIPNLLEHLLKGTPYIPDGYDGSSEAKAVAKFTEFFNANKNNKDFISALNGVYTDTLAGRTVGHTANERKYENSTEDVDNKKLISHLAASTDIQGALGGVLSPDQIGYALSEYQRSNKLLSSINNALKLGGSEKNFPDMTALKFALVSDPALKSAIVLGITRAAKSSNTRTLTEDRGQLKVSEAQRKLLEQLDTGEGQALMKEGIQKGFDTQLKSLIAEGKMNPAQKADAEKAISEYMAQLSNPSVMALHIQGAGAAITNKGIGAGISAGTKLDTFFADNLSVGIGLGTGKPAAGVGVTFSKALTKDVNFLYGWAGTPFAGLSSQFDTYNVTLIGSKLGGTVIVQKDMNKRGSNIRTLDSMKEDMKNIEQIEAFAKDPSKKSSDIAFTGGTAVEGKDPTVLTKERLASLNSDISREIQIRLSMSGFDSEKSPTVRASMIRQAMVEVAQDRIDRINIDAQSGGFSLSKVGVILGFLAKVPFILPTVSFERVNLRITSERTAGTTQISETRAGDAPARRALESPAIEEKIGIQSVDTRDALANREKLYSQANGILEMSRMPDQKTFQKALKQISAGNYDEAHTTLSSVVRSSKVISGIVEATRNDKTLLQQVLTYTYISQFAGLSEVSPEQYIKARSEPGVISSETKLAGYDIAQAEPYFMTSQHKPTPLSSLIPGQALSVDVFATPRIRNTKDSSPYHRVDRFSGSITVSDKILTEIDDNTKDTIIKRHSADIERNRNEMNTYLKTNNFPEIRDTEYASLLKTGNLPKSLTDKGVTLDKSPVIAQIRAMINGRSCLNGGDAIGYPTVKFVIAGKKAEYRDIPAQPVTVTSAEYNPGGVRVQVASEGQSLTGAAGYVGDRPTKPEPAKVEESKTQPGDDGKLTPVPTPVTPNVPPKVGDAPSRSLPGDANTLNPISPVTSPSPGVNTGNSGVNTGQTTPGAGNPVIRPSPISPGNSPSPGANIDNSGVNTGQTTSGTGNPVIRPN